MSSSIKDPFRDSYVAFKMKLPKISLLLFCLVCFSCVKRQENVGSVKYTPSPLFNYGSDAVIKKRYTETGGLYDRDYELTIKGNGQVTIDANTYKPKPYHEEWNVPPENFSRLVDAFQDSSFYKLNAEESGPLAIDGSITTIFISVNGQEKQVKRFSGNSEDEKTLTKLQTIINKEAGAEPYIRKCCYFPPQYAFESIP